MFSVQRFAGVTLTLPVDCHTLCRGDPDCTGFIVTDTVCLLKGRPALNGDLLVAAASLSHAMAL